MPAEPLSLRVTESRWEAEGIVSFTLASGDPLPVWEPGAHVDVHLPSGLVRQYSLCGDPADRSKYRIAVLALPGGRGGSLEAHRELRPGQVIRVGVPRQTFPQAEADRYVFVAGGIGITPLLPMIRAAVRSGAPWELVYGARSAAHFAFAAEIGISEAVHLIDAPLDLEKIVAGSAGAKVYACGPGGMLDALQTLMEAAGRGSELHVERFAAPISASAAVTGFEVELTRTGIVVPVGPESSILESVRAAGADVPSSCEMGFCGTCETKVLSGAVDHRDDLLTEEERAQGGTMMICVSRAASARLVLDL
ncbi:PDR/VanB family oxidoreductase [Actinoplanes sp. CA-015351]|uniref:PDR/VanB family oxidoreductase n=1 Tax=Actinoplanes sp. CA-015351 TaxID=3239897 RepID=UPI003D968105